MAYTVKTRLSKGLSVVFTMNINHRRSISRRDVLSQKPPSTSVVPIHKHTYYLLYGVTTYRPRPASTVNTPTAIDAHLAQWSAVAQLSEYSFFPT